MLAYRTVPSITPADSSNEVYATMHIGDGSNFIEVGFGFNAECDGPAYTYCIYGSDSSDNSALHGTTVTVSPGQSFYLMIWSGGSDTWEAGYYDASNTFHSIFSATLACGVCSTSSSPNAVVEEYTSSGNWPQVSNASVNGIWLCPSGCSEWLLWDPTKNPKIPGAPGWTSSIYPLTLNNEWYDWLVSGG